jgi:hypothetical protein
MEPAPAGSAARSGTPPAGGAALPFQQLRQFLLDRLNGGWPVAAVDVADDSLAVDDGTTRPGTVPSIGFKGVLGAIE